MCGGQATACQCVYKVTSGIEEDGQLNQMWVWSFRTAPKEHLKHHLAPESSLIREANLASLTMPQKLRNLVNETDNQPARCFNAMLQMPWNQLSAAPGRDKQ